jgi:hypothetical protein
MVIRTKENEKICYTHNNRLQFTRRNSPAMRNRGFRPIAAILSVLLLTGSPAKAGPVSISEVIQVLGSYQYPPDLQLRSASQYSAVVHSGVKGSLQSGITEQSDTSLGSVASSASSLLSGVTVVAGQDIGVDVIDQGDVEGTVCDCGEIMVPGGGFPKWPLLFLAAIPFLFIHDCDDCDEKPTPTPTPPGTSEVPEPGSLVLFGMGLAAFGAGLRRRYTRGKLATHIQAMEED